MTRPPRATIDFETRSACSLKKSGSWRYSLDPSTQPLCMAYRLPTWPVGRTALWHPEFRHLGMKESRDYDTLIELMAWVEAGNYVEAHNAWFERGIWKNIMVPAFGWPTIDSMQWRCSAAKAAAHALPRGLEMAGEALRLSERKDDAGTKVMKKMTKPRKARKKEREFFGDDQVPTLYFEDRHLMRILFLYCRQDVLAEENLSLAVPDLSPDEEQLFMLDQEINERGFQLDREAVESALALIAEESKVLNAELAQLTGGKVLKATQRAQMKAWFESEGLSLPDTQGATLDEYMKEIDRFTVGPHVKRALEVVRTLGRSSTAKYEAMRNWASPEDWRVRGGLLFHGATTGRWSGAGVQPHNFPKGPLDFKKLGLGKEESSLTPLWDTLKTRDRVVITKRYGKVMEALSHGLRGAITAAPGHQLYVADFAGIEARVVLWQAGDEKALDDIRKGVDSYLKMASRIYNYPCTKEDHPKERALGKVAILGLGFQMGPSKFVDSAAKAGIMLVEDIDCAECGRVSKGHDRDSDHSFKFSKGDGPDTITAVRVVAAYREEFYLVQRSWWDTEAAAIQAVAEPGRVFHAGVCSWYTHRQFLYCKLPSGRKLAYPFPEIHEKLTPWGEPKPSLTYMGMDSYTRQWRRQTGYGGLLVENLTQAIARDLMAHGLQNIEQHGTYRPVLTVHDEAVAEALQGKGSVHEFEQLMCQTPDWATNCPVGAEGWCGERYRK